MTPDIIVRADLHCNGEIGMNAMFDEKFKENLQHMNDARRTLAIGKVALSVISMRKRGAGDGQRVREAIAKELGIGTRTVDRSIAFARGMDAITCISPSTADRILTGELNPMKISVINVAKAPEEQRFALVNVIARGHLRETPNTGNSKEDRAAAKEIRSIIDTFSDGAVMEYTVDNLTDQIRTNAEAFIRTIANLLADHRDLCDGNEEIISDVLEKKIVRSIEEIRGRILYGTQL